MPMRAATRVASITEAWIETGVTPFVSTKKRVASITEAWIETHRFPDFHPYVLSPPSRRRGSKPVNYAW